MPIYEYTCAACGNNFEILVRSGSGEGPACPACGSAETAKRVSSAASPGSSPDNCQTGGG